MPTFIRGLLLIPAVALLETTAPALLLTLWGAPSAWPILVAVAIAAAACDWLARRALRPEQQRPAVAIAALVLAGAVARVVVPDGDLRMALLDRTSPYNIAAYAGLLVGLYTAWRGLRLPDAERSGLRELFARAMGTTLLALLIGTAAVGARDPVLLAAATGELLCGVAAGLVAAALAHSWTIGPAASRPAGWRGAAPVGLAIGLILVAGIVLVGVLGEEGRLVLVVLGDLLALLLTALLVPIVLALMPLIEWLLLALHAPEALAALRDWARQLNRSNEEPIELLAELQRLLPWLGPALAWAGRLLPVLLLLALVWLVARRRSTPRDHADEERVSLFSWAALRGDLRDLLARLRRRDMGEGLQAALGRLRGEDPESRVRRAYLRMLLLAEERGVERAPSRTPHEFIPEACAALGASAAIERLTGTYEGARYYPGSTTPAAALAAEQAQAEIAETAG